jgi:hypothetical protein
MSNDKQGNAAPAKEPVKPGEWEPIVTEQYLDYLEDLIDEAVRDDNFLKEVVNGLDNLISDFRGLRGKYEDLKEKAKGTEKEIADYRRLLAEVMYCGNCGGKGYDYVADGDDVTAEGCDCRTDATAKLESWTDYVSEYHQLEDRAERAEAKLRGIVNFLDVRFGMNAPHALNGKTLTPLERMMAAFEALSIGKK